MSDFDVEIKFSSS